MNVCCFGFQKKLEGVELKLLNKRSQSFCGCQVYLVTSQLFGNMYMNEFDQFVKHVLKVKYYFRYCDDFIILGNQKEDLEKALVRYIEPMLRNRLSLNLHPDKVEIRKLSQGIDFLGYVVLPHARVLRTKTKRRILKQVCERNKISYLGVLSHCRGRKLREFIKNI